MTASGAWADAVRWVRARSWVEWLAIGLGLAVFAYLGNDAALWDPRFQVALHLAGAGVVAAVAVAALRGLPLPRTPIDVPLLGLLAAFALATASAMNTGMSLRAMASIVGFAAMLPVALLAIRHRPSWVGLVVSIPTLVLAIPGLFVLLERRVEWILVGAPGLPPIRLPSEGSPFGSVAVPPFVLWPAWAIAGLIEPPWLRRTVRTGLVAVAVPYTILSGSRSAWLAIGATALIVGAPWAWANRGRVADRLRGHPTATWATGIGGALALVAIAVLVAPRVTAVASLLYRVSLWRDTLTAWATDPLTGIGPGFMPIARQAAAADGTFPVRQPHSHNLPLGVLGDAGLVGLAAAIVLVVILAMVAGPWRSRTPTGRAAATVLLGLGIGGLFEDITFMPNFGFLAIVLVAMALTDAGAVRWAPLSLPSRLRVAAPLAAAVGGLALLAGMLTSDAGAVAYRLGSDAVVARNRVEAAARFEQAAAIDPWHPSPPKALAIVAGQLGEWEESRSAAETAVARNPGDGQSWIDLALACRELGDDACSRRAADRAVATSEFAGAELITAALLLDDLGETAAADDAYRQALLGSRLATFGVDWPRAVPIGDAALAEDFGALGELNRLLALRAAGEPFVADEIADPSVRALAHAMDGNDEEARDAIDSAIDAAPDQLFTWEVAVILAHHRGDPIDELLRIGELVRGREFPDPDRATPTPRLSYDLAVFRAVPADGMLPAAERLQTRPPWPWILESALP
ncbi:MAG TPA: O-antigen ligase family protein [Candidatus Limnocylindria bacterium]